METTTISNNLKPKYSLRDFAYLKYESKVIDEFENKTMFKAKNCYSARICLTLKTAYNNALLIVKPESYWLRPRDNYRTFA